MIIQSFQIEFVFFLTTLSLKQTRFEKDFADDIFSHFPCFLSFIMQGVIHEFTTDRLFFLLAIQVNLHLSPKLAAPISRTFPGHQCKCRCQRTIKTLQSDNISWHPFHQTPISSTHHPSRQQTGNPPQCPMIPESHVGDSNQGVNKFNADTENNNAAIFNADVGSCCARNRQSLPQYNSPGWVSRRPFWCPGAESGLTL